MSKLQKIYLRFENRQLLSWSSKSWKQKVSILETKAFFSGTISMETSEVQVQRLAEVRKVCTSGIQLTVGQKNFSDD